jgi:tRNA(Ser,Leu) C12 N-acetylase TAN1
VYDSPQNPVEEAEMTKALEEVFREASKLPEAEQDALAEAIKAEIEAEKDWDKSFASSLDVLGRLADEAIADHRAGRTKPIDPDKM